MFINLFDTKISNLMITFFPKQPKTDLYSKPN